MSFHRRKNGIAWSALIEMLLLIAGVSLIITTLAIASEKADDKSAELLCRGFNALRFGTNTLAERYTFTGVSEANPTPRVCRTIDKKDVPSSDYAGHVNGPKEGAMAEIRDMTARCWWMWLEGQEKNMFERNWYSPGKESCFICYTFALDKKADQFSYGDFFASMEKPYYAIDSSDKCAPGYGGKCKYACSDEEKTIPSTKCNSNELFGGGRSGGAGSSANFADEITEIKSEIKETSKDSSIKCCISKYPNDECRNKGGICDRAPIGQHSFYYSKWSCQDDNCYVDPQYVVSYLDYVQGTKGVELGEGKILFAGNEGFSPGSKYAITFISPGNNLDWGVFKGLGIALAGRGIVYLIPGAGQVALAAQSVALIWSSNEVINAGTPSDINYIMISKYDTVKDKCSVEASSGTK